MRTILLFIWFVFLSSINPMMAQPPAAFPGAEGAGMFASGGRGGKTMIVSNLRDDGPGSLRAALETEGPRTVVFSISGTINLQSDLQINHGDITIAGQSAPGDGICLRNYPLHVNASNVIIRYLRIRLGDESGEPSDAINCKRQSNVIIDHCSFSWSVDETASFYDNENFTLQWCIISESLNNSVHPKGPHGYGGIWGGMNASFHHNLLAHHVSRLPRFQGARYHKMPDKEKAEFSNNVMYNWASKSSYGGEEGSYNMLNNYYKPGPATPEKKSDVMLEVYDPPGDFYLHGNVTASSEQVSEHNREGVIFHNDVPEDVFLSEKVVVDPALSIQSAKRAYAMVLQKAGASQRRDAVDRRIVREVRDGTFTYGEQGIINSQKEVGGWPELRSRPAPPDRDQDGIPDQWEKQHQLNPENAEDARQVNESASYTNLEVYLNELVK